MPGLYSSHMKPVQITISAQNWTESSWSFGEIPVVRSNSKTPVPDRAGSLSFFERNSANPAASSKHARQPRPRVIKCGEGSFL